MGNGQGALGNEHGNTGTANEAPGRDPFAAPAPEVSRGDGALRPRWSRRKRTLVTLAVVVAFCVIAVVFVAGVVITWLLALEVVRGLTGCYPSYCF